MNILNDPDLALINGAGTIILYRPSLIEQGYYQYDAIVGAIAGEKSGKYNHISTVAIDPSSRGQGHVLYDIAMYLWGPITQCDGPTSASAWRVWDYYLNQRADLVVEIFDKEEFYNEFEEIDPDPNRTYFVVAGAKPDIKLLQLRHEETMESLHDRQQFENSFWGVAIRWMNDLT
jgi:hypothetical protein